MSPEATRHLAARRDISSPLEASVGSKELLLNEPERAFLVAIASGKKHHEIGPLGSTRIDRFARKVRLKLHVRTDAGAVFAAVKMDELSIDALPEVVEGSKQDVVSNDRARTVLKLLALGYKDAEIAEAAGFSEVYASTVGFRLRQKARASSNPQLIAIALRSGGLSLEEITAEEMEARAKLIFKEGRIWHYPHVATPTDVLRYLVNGDTQKEIARKLALDEGSVRDQITDIQTWFGVHSSIDLVLIALQQGYLNALEFVEDFNLQRVHNLTKAERGSLQDLVEAGIGKRTIAALAKKYDIDTHAAWQRFVRIYRKLGVSNLLQTAVFYEAAKASGIPVNNEEAMAKKRIDPRRERVGERMPWRGRDRNRMGTLRWGRDVAAAVPIEVIERMLVHLERRGESRDQRRNKYMIEVDEYRRLDDEHKLVVWLRDIKKIKLSEVAEILGVAKKTAENLHRRAVRQLGI